MQKIESRISELQSQYKKLIDDRNREITKLVSKLELNQYDNETLMGGLLFVQNTLSSNPQLLEEWKSAGETFLQKSKTRIPKNKSKTVSSKTETQPTTPTAQSRKAHDEESEHRTA